MVINLAVYIYFYKFEKEKLLIMLVTAELVKHHWSNVTTMQLKLYAMNYSTYVLSENNRVPRLCVMQYIYICPEFS